MRRLSNIRWDNSPEVIERLDPHTVAALAARHTRIGGCGGSTAPGGV